jgi:hypothetical protein
VRNNSDYDLVDLAFVDDNFYPLTKYKVNLPINEYINKTPKLPNGSYFIDFFRYSFRGMLNLTQERTLIGALIQPKVSFIYSLIGLKCSNTNILLLLSSFYSSLIFDFIIKILSKKNFNIELASKLPIVPSRFDKSLILHTLLLNCLLKDYQPIWQESFSPTFQQEKWAKVDPRLNNARFSTLTPDWTWNTPLRTDYERRQALVEIDVLAAMALGLSLEHLQTAYRIQFPVLNYNEANTWYDQNGRIVFTTSKSLIGVGLERKEWEYKKESSQIITRTVTVNTKDGPMERTIEYVPPFDRYDREKDYETAWKFFTEKFTGTTTS